MMKANYSGQTVATCVRLGACAPVLPASDSSKVRIGACAPLLPAAAAGKVRLGACAPVSIGANDAKVRLGACAPVLLGGWVWQGSPGRLRSGGCLRGCEQRASGCVRSGAAGRRCRQGSPGRLRSGGCLRGCEQGASGVRAPRCCRPPLPARFAWAPALRWFPLRMRARCVWVRAPR